MEEKDLRLYRETDGSGSHHPKKQRKMDKMAESTDRATKWCKD